MLEVRNIGKVYGSGRNAFRALDDVNINFGSKGLVIILGKSGCGKSTLLNIIGGLDAPTEGEVIINGRSTKKFKRSDFDAYRNTFVGIVFQEFNLIDEISVFDNINMTMKLQESNTDVNTVDEALAMVGLQNLGYRKPSELSGGQRQRVSLARALLKKPEIVLADEPTGALDSATGEEVFETLKKIALEKLVIVVTHNRELANAYGDRIIEISDGKIVSDTTRVVSGDDSVKELPGGVIEVSSTGAVSAAALNAKLVPGRTNYIGLSHDKDRIALAYPDTVDSFYSPSEAAAFAGTKPENIPTDNKEFRLSKGGITFKESVKLARGNIKRHKKRFRFINVIATLCFVFVALGLMVGTVNVPNIVADTAFDTASAFVQVAMYEDTQEYMPAPSKLSAESTESIKSIVGGALGYGTNLFATPELAMVENDVPYNSEYSQWGYSESYGASYDFSYFNGVIEVASAADIGLELVAGVPTCANTSEIIISDFAAYMLGKKGFIGMDRNGKMDVQYLPDVESMVGCSINIKQTKRLYKVVGVFKTDFRKYASMVSDLAMYDSSNEDLTREFMALQKYDYRKIIGPVGLAKELASSGSSLYVSFEKDGQTVIYERPMSASSLTYDKSLIRADDKDYNKPRIVWSRYKNADNKYIAPETLGEKEVIIPYDFASDILQQWGSPDEIISSSNFNSQVVSPQFTVRISGGSNSGSMLRLNEMKIAALVEGGSGRGSFVSFNGSVAEEIFTAGAGYDFVVFPRGGMSGSLEGKVTELKDAGYSVGSALANIATVRELDSTLSTMSKVFLYIALGMFVFAFFIIFNYISTSVRFRTKEIAVYRVIGAKSSDISRIFLTEGGGIVLRTSIASIIISFLVSLLLDTILGGVMSSFGITFTIIRFNWLIEPLAIIVGSALTVLISSLIPVMRVTSKRPVEAVKMI